MQRLREFLRAALACFARSPQQSQFRVEPMEPLPGRHVDRVHGEDELMTFGVVQDGKALTQAEHHFRDGAGLRTVRTKGRVVTRGGEIVPPEKLLGRCILCGGYESVIYRCCRCDGVLCGRDVRRLQTTHGELWFCPKDFLEHLEHVNTWRRG